MKAEDKTPPPSLFTTQELTATHAIWALIVDWSLKTCKI